MELRVLNYFLSVAREESFTKAAQQLHLTQPTLSRQIAQLEEELGVCIFRRANGRVTLTEDGMILRRRAQELLSLADKTKRDFLYKGKELEGTVAVGSGEFLSTRILTDCMAAFRKDHPLVHFELYSGNAANIRDKIERGLLDLGLMSEPVDIRKYEFGPMPQKEQWGAIVPIGSPLAEKEFITPKDLEGIPVVSAVSDIAQGNIGRWLGEGGSKVDIIAKGNLLYNEVMMARSNGGAAIGIRLDSRYDGTVFIPFSPALESGTAVAWKKEQVFPAAASAFMEFVRSYIKGIYKYGL